MGLDYAGSKVCDSGNSAQGMRYDFPVGIEMCKSINDSIKGCVKLGTPSRSEIVIGSEHIWSVAASGNVN